MFFRKHKEQLFRSNAVIPVVLLSVFFGLAGGAVSVLLMLAYFPSLGMRVYSELATAPRVEIQMHTGRPAIDFVIKDISASTALLFRNEDVTGLPLVTKAVGSGAVLTTNGWLMTHQAALINARRLDARGLTAMIGGKMYPVTKMVADPFSDVVFLKVEAANLTVSALSQNHGSSVGDALFSFDVAGGLREAEVIDIDGLPATDATSAVRSSEKAQRMLRLSDGTGFVPGAAMLNSAGEVVGVFVGSSAVGVYMVPVGALADQIDSVLRDGQTARPFLGVHFLDLAEYPPAIGATKGAKLSSSARVAAVVHGSPAAAAGLEEDDVIEAVNDDKVSANNSLPELVAEYSPEQKITLTILRDGAEKKVEVSLGRVE